MKFEIRSDINVRDRSLVTSLYADRSKEDIARAVAFYLDLITSYSKDRIAVGFGTISLLSVAFMLALHKSGREFTVIYHNGNLNFDEYRHLYSHLFITGNFISSHLEKIQSLASSFPEQIILTDTIELESQAYSYHNQDNLVFEYTKDKNVYIVFNGNSELLYTTEKIEGSSIEAAIENYFHEDDYVVLMRSFQHLGVGTLSIFPAFFKVKNISMCSFLLDWEQEYHNATHIHIDMYMMKIGCKLPPKLRMLTSGGYDFNSDCVDYVTKQSDIENIIDCFGTAKCPPPLAIRKLPNNLDSYFIWVNNFIKPIAFSELNVLSFDTDEHSFSKLTQQQIATNDVVKFADNSYNFKIVNRIVSSVRMLHKLHAVEEFKKLFKEYSGIEDFKVEYEIVDSLQSPIVFVNEKDFDHATAVFDKFIIESKLKIK